MKTILLTGATDGIGFETAKMLVAQGFHLLIHGRNAKKLEQTKAQLNNTKISGSFTTPKFFFADLS